MVKCSEQETLTFSFILVDIAEYGGPRNLGGNTISSGTHTCIT